MTKSYFSSILIIDQDIIIPATSSQDQEPPAWEAQEQTEGPDLDLVATEVCLKGGVR